MRSRAEEAWVRDTLQRGFAASEAGHLKEAEAAYVQALQLRPGLAWVHYNLGNVLQAQGRLQEAADSFRKTVELQPDSVEAYCNLGSVLKAIDAKDEAIVAFRKAIEIRPDSLVAHYNLGNALKERGDPLGAIASYRKTLVLDPKCVDAYLNLGEVLVAQDRADEAIACYRDAIRQDIDDFDTLRELGTRFRLLDVGEDAEHCMRAATKLRPGSGPAHQELGIVLHELRRFADAEASLLQALSLTPDTASGYNDLGVIYLNWGRASDAERCFQRALNLAPLESNFHGNLALALIDLGRTDQAVASYRRALELRKDDAAVFSKYLFLLSYSGIVTAEQYLAEAKRWEIDVVSEAIRTQAAARTFPPRALHNRRLRVGYISGDFRVHAVSHFLEPILRNHDRTRFEIVAFPTTNNRDAVTGRLRQHVDQWHLLSGLADGPAAELVTSLGIDVLVDLSGHTAHNRLGIFARRAAPVQCHYLGYFASTGLSTMDYLIADSQLVPEGQEGQYSERIWRLPRVWVSYAPTEEAPASNWEPGPGDRVCFGSFNHLNKVDERSIRVWSKLLARLPNARLILKTKELDDPSNRDRIASAFRAHDIDPERIQMLGRVADWKAHMAGYDKLDIALDPIGSVGGGTTTCDALWMGVPVVALAGDRLASRMTASMLAAIGRPEWVARSEDEYIDIAFALAVDVDLRWQWRRAQRGRVERSPLCDARGLAAQLETAYVGMFEKAQGNSVSLGGSAQ